MIFWPLAACLVLITILIAVRPLVARRGTAAPRAAHDLQVFRDQLSALDRDVERGVLTEQEAGGARAEISRRLLSAAAEAAKVEGAAPGPDGAARGLAAALAALIVVGGGGVYAWIGAPGAPDQPLSSRLAEIERAAPTRPSQAEAERIVAARREAAEGAASARQPSPEDAELAERAVELQRVLADRPDDLRGRRLLAGVLMTLDRPAAAMRVHEEILALLGAAAEPDDLVAAAEAMILTVDGYVSPEAEARIAQALQRSPTNRIGRYYAGLAMAQNGQFGLALNLWRALLEEGPPDAPWIAAIEARIGDLARAAGEGVDLSPPVRGAAPGPTEAEIDAAREMSPEDRALMIEGMVAGLENRLAAEGGGPHEWERLLNAYRVLDRPEDAARIWAEVERVFADAPPEIVARLREAARAAGVDLPTR